MADTSIRPHRALLSVFDKSGIVDFARGLATHGIELVSTGGTHRLLAEAGLQVREVSELTGFPEMMDGRVKTLHPKVHGGLLAVRDNPAHSDAMTKHEIGAIDLVVVNLYPFERTVASGASYADIIDNIDIGGPAMLRSAAKNHAFVSVLTDPDDYESILSAIAAGGIPHSLRQKLAAKAYARTAAYDSAISGWFARELNYHDIPARSFSGTLREIMRYGENPHQWAAFYVTGEERPGVASAVQVQGKTLSYNNINDTDAAFELVSEFDPAEAAAAAIIKHANPCGVAVAETLAEAYRRALRTDPASAFGGIVALNREIDAETATEIVKIFTEVIVAPAASVEAKEIIAAKKNLRLLLTGGMADPKAEALVARTVAGGLLVQSRDNRNVDACELRTVTRRQPNERELVDLRLAAKVAKHVKSNTIVYVRDGATVGIGAGQMSRVDSAILAHRKSMDAARAAGLEGALTEGSVAASDAFFPFADGLEALVAAGATAVIQPGGSVRDEEVIAAADKAGLAMVFTGTRHFRH